MLRGLIPPLDVSHRRITKMHQAILADEAPCEDERDSYPDEAEPDEMQMPSNMTEAFNWQQNTQDGTYLFANDKLGRAGNYENSLRELSRSSVS